MSERVALLQKWLGDWVSAQQVVARKYLEKVTHYAASMDQWKKGCGRAVVQLNVWNGVFDSEPVQCPFAGYSVEVEQEGPDNTTTTMVLSEPTAAELDGLSIAAAKPNFGQGTTMAVLFEDGLPTPSQMTRSVVSAADEARARSCGRCHHRTHGKQPCPVEGCCPPGDAVALCKPTCPRCPHLPHKGVRCPEPECADAPKRAQCNSTCKLEKCAHPGSRRAHADKGW
jgi:hypothetical protein